MAHSQRQAFIDWMKVIGMFLIVFGHVIGSHEHLFNQFTQPIYTKQLGVAFFIFIMGWGLANETSSDWLQVVYKRLFPIYFYGVGIALVVSVISWFTANDLNESNYLPFAFGANVLLNYFPANPSTWYIGTYFHVLLLWAVLLRHISFNKWWFLAAIVCEVVVRALLIAANKDFIAYMLLPNWLGVFLLGYCLAKQGDCGFSRATGLVAAAWLLGLLLWAYALNPLNLDNDFPFRNLPDYQGHLAILLKSMVISSIYLVNTWLAFQLARRLFVSKWVSLIARNTLLIFIIHMPVIYAFTQDFYSLFGYGDAGRLLWILVIFFGIALFSEAITRAININTIRDWLWNLLRHRKVPAS
ncbi:MAG: acyltransferase [Cellvibrionaceae bacterium]|nr:acyltransferase [Cellvibrionaceae bacterium]